MPRVRRKKRRSRRRRHEALVHQHLEWISRDLLERHPDIVRRFIGRNSGIYALYRKNRLYYVGLARSLRGRLRSHTTDRHGDRWDRFSIYLTIKDQHIKELESLMLRLARPTGNRMGGKPAGSIDMRTWIRKAIREKQELEVSRLFERRAWQPKKKAAVKEAEEKFELAQLLPQGAKLKGDYKGRVYRATARRDGRVRFNGQTYKSLREAAQSAVKRRMSGWYFWQIERARGHWVRLIKIRAAGTPVYKR